MSADAPTPAPAGQYLARRRNHLGSIKKDLGDLQGWRSLIAELIQNADDASDATEMSFTIDNNALTVWNDGTFSKCDELDAQICPWQLRGDPACDFHSFSDVAGGAKEDRADATGAFGIGFTAVYQVTDVPVLTSAGKRWTIDETRPEESRIYSEDVADQGGTRFVLPWARELTYMRQALEQPVVTSDSIRELTDELFNSVPESMLFLRRLTRVRVCTDTRTVSFSRSRSDRTIEVESSDGEVKRWHVLDGSLATRADNLRETYPNELRRPRSSSFSVAVSLTGGSFPGRFYATLPTEESTGLPASLQGSFFPKPDRKRIRLDNAPKDDWNRAIIEEAAALLAASLEEIRDAGRDDALVTLLTAAVELGRRQRANEVDQSFGSWWECLSNALPSANVVPTVSGEYRSPRTALLWGGHDSEAAAGAVLAELGLDLVAPEVRAPWFAFRESTIGIQQLNLGHLVSAFVRAESDVPGGWASGCSADALAALWGLLEHLVSTQGRSTAESRDALLGRRMFPLIDGTFSDAVSAASAIAGTAKLLGDASVDAPLLDSRRLRECPKLVEMVEEVAPADMVEWMERGFNGGSIPSDFDRGRLLDWFTNRDVAVLASVPDGLRSLPIFPTGTGYQRLGVLALPVEGFKDPLDLAEVLHLEGRPAGTRAFLEGLGARELTLRHYCTEFVVRAVQFGINDAQLRALLSFLGTELSRVHDDVDVRDALADLELVTCTDRERRRGAEVYFAGADALLVGPDRPIAGAASPAVRRLYEWLGVSATPRPTDVVQHCRSLGSAPSNLRETATAVLRYVADEEEAWERDFKQLQALHWLPVQGEHKTAAQPSAVHTIFQQNLFRSQADFLDIGQRDQARCAAALRWLGVETEPTVEQVVGHLLHCRDAQAPVKSDMWDFLARHVEDSALERLLGEPCILLDNGVYVIGSHCFWSENPFGRHRHHLGERFRQWSDLFERFGVREHPGVTDAVDVLQGIAAAHGGAVEPLLTADAEVVDSCWVFLDRLVRENGVGSEDFTDLASTECVLAADGTLQRPRDVLFRDSSAISAEFDEEARRFLIARPENASQALEAAGVRHLRDALTTSVVERIDAEGRSLLEERFEGRRLLVVRVLAASDDAASTKVAKFTQSVDIVPLHQLTVVERIEVAGRAFESSPFDRAALFRSEVSEMLVAERDAGNRRWDEIATEVAFALGVDPDDVPSTAMSLKVVLEADTPEAVVRVLDAMRFPPLDEAIHIDVTDEVVDTFADEESVDETWDQDSAEERADDGAEPEVPEAFDEPVQREGPTPERAGEAPTVSTAESKAGPDSEAGGGSGGGAETSTDGEARKEGGAAPGVRPTGDAKRGEQDKKRDSHKQREREQLRSYLQPEGETGSARERDGLSEEQRRKVDAAAVDAVVAYEERVGRTPERMPHENEGFDVRSVVADGSVRFIEVKGTSPEWDRQGVALSSRQFQEARSRNDEFWLYVVEVGKPGADPIRIQDPANRVRQYFLDSGWRIADEERERLVRPLPQLLIHDEPPTDGAVRFIDWRDGVTQLGWIGIDIEQPSPDVYALQIAGDALGLALRGGVVIANPGVPEERDWVVIRLADQLDADTGAAVCIRQWVPERDFGGTLLGVRLQSDGSIPPITVEDPSTVQILGIVSHQLRVDDLSTVVSADG